jgi:hypothetical protein
MRVGSKDKRWRHHEETHDDSSESQPTHPNIQPSSIALLKATQHHAEGTRTTCACPQIRTGEPAHSDCSRLGGPWTRTFGKTTRRNGSTWCATAPRPRTEPDKPSEGDRRPAPSPTAHPPSELERVIPQVFTRRKQTSPNLPKPAALDISRFHTSNRPVNISGLESETTKRAVRPGQRDKRFGAFSGSHAAPEQSREIAPDPVPKPASAKLRVSRRFRGPGVPQLGGAHSRLGGRKRTEESPAVASYSTPMTTSQLTGVYDLRPPATHSQIRCRSTGARPSNRSATLPSRCAHAV